MLKTYIIISGDSFDPIEKANPATIIYYPAINRSLRNNFKTRKRRLSSESCGHNYEDIQGFMSSYPTTFNQIN